MIRIVPSGAAQRTRFIGCRGASIAPYERGVQEIHHRVAEFLVRIPSNQASKALTLLVVRRLPRLGLVLLAVIVFGLFATNVVVAWASAHPVATKHLSEKGYGKEPPPTSRDYRDVTYAKRRRAWYLRANGEKATVIIAPG
jgi:hypothetical protein